MVHSLKGWERGFGVLEGIKQRPRRQVEWLRDHILKYLWCQGHTGLVRHKVGEEQNLIFVLERSLRLPGRKAKSGIGAAREEVFAVTHRKDTSSPTWGRAMGLKTEGRVLGEALAFIFSICSHDP